MPKFRVNITMEQKGLLFNAAASKAAVQRAVVEVNDVLAQEGVQRFQTRLKTVLRNPSGFYQRNIMVDRRTVYRGFSDNNVAYGGWLEGVSSLNRATRFKGYHTFRLVRQSLNQDKAAIAAPVITRLVRELNG